MREKVKYLIGIAAAIVLGSSAAMMWPQPVRAAAPAVTVCANTGCGNRFNCIHEFGHFCDLLGTQCATGSCS